MAAKGERRLHFDLSGEAEADVYLGLRLKTPTCNKKKRKAKVFVLAPKSSMNDASEVAEELRCFSPFLGWMFASGILHLN